MEAMTGKQENRDALIRLANALVEDVLSASEGEILVEAREDKVDVESVARAGRSQFESIAATIARRRLTEAKAAVAAQRSPATVARLDLVAARRQLERLLAQDPETAQKLTLAARKGQSLSDDDVLDMLADLKELGFQVDEDEQG
jgi:hypothetical protein